MTKFGPGALADITSIVLPEGDYTIRQDVDDIVVDATGARHSDRQGPHPALTTVATLAATGMPIEELLNLCHSTATDGPMLGECRVDFRRELRFDIPYRVSRRLLALQRKKSRRFGAMDMLRFMATMSEPAGAIVAEVTYTWVLPKPEK